MRLPNAPQLPNERRRARGHRDRTRKELAALIDYLKLSGARPYPDDIIALERAYDITGKVVQEHIKRSLSGPTGSPTYVERQGDNEN